LTEKRGPRCRLLEGKASTKKLSVTPRAAALAVRNPYETRKSGPVGREEILLPAGTSQKVLQLKRKRLSRAMKRGTEKGKNRSDKKHAGLGKEKYRSFKRGKKPSARQEKRRCPELPRSKKLLLATNSKKKKRRYQKKNRHFCPRKKLCAEDRMRKKKKSVGREPKKKKVATQKALKGYTPVNRKTKDPHCTLKKRKNAPSAPLQGSLIWEIKHKKGKLLHPGVRRKKKEKKDVATGK